MLARCFRASDRGKAQDLSTHPIAFVGSPRELLPGELPTGGGDSGKLLSRSHPSPPSSPSHPSPRDLLPGEFQPVAATMVLGEFRSSNFCGVKKKDSTLARTWVGGEGRKEGVAGFLHARRRIDHLECEACYLEAIQKLTWSKSSPTVVLQVLVPMSSILSVREPQKVKL
ncbi:uncharacterized protein LOC123426025 [Hordeum vulgare subsp. vulgare]|uniref:uncharacterized protein LOC123426025 n=1 Tax=Hordeum vulgare subsp. vulgare TaxID=112509 RepID=UPI001D1A49C7|nr:uncharacterized protein LOC123426025 [Hordeum vulgare subsp. vulgare]